MATDNQKVHGIIHVAAASAAAVGAGMAQLPGSDAPVLIAIQTAMISAIGEVHNQRITKEKAFTLLSTFMATVGGRTLSQWLIGWMPGWGNAVNATTAATITEAIGWAADAYFSNQEKNKVA